MYTALNKKPQVRAKLLTQNRPICLRDSVKVKCGVWQIESDAGTIT